FTEYLREIGVKQLFSDPHAPWMNRIERQWGFLKSMLTKNEIATGSKAWVKVLPTLVKNMNETVNSSMKVTPEQAEEGGLPRDINDDRSKNYGIQKRHLSTKSTFKVGDLVRIRLRNTG